MVTGESPRSGSAVGPTFVVSTGRCGSTLMSRMLHQHRDVLSLSEVFSTLQPAAFPRGMLDGEQFWATLSRPRGLWATLVENHLEPAEFLYEFADGSRFDRTKGVPPLCTIAFPSLVRDADAMHSEVEAFVRSREPDEVGSWYITLFSWLAQRLGRRCWAERSGASLAWLRELMRVFPAARYVHLYRSGVATSLSMSRHPAFRMLLITGQIARCLGVDPYESENRSQVDRLPPGWCAFLPESFDPQLFRDVRLPLESFATMWAYMEARGLRLLDALPGERVLHMRYEDLLADPWHQLERLASFMQFDPSTRSTASWMATAASMIRVPMSSNDSDEVDERVLAACAIGEARFRERGLPI